MEDEATDTEDTDTDTDTQRNKLARRGKHPVNDNCRGVYKVDEVQFTKLNSKKTNQQKRQNLNLIKDGKEISTDQYCHIFYDFYWSI